MRPHQIIGGMSQEQFDGILGAIGEESPEAVQSTTVAAAQVLKFRPKFLLKQPKAKRAKQVKGALARMSAGSLAEELLAVYFLKCRLPLLTEWLDLMGLEHEEGILTQDDVPAPERAELERKVAEFRGAGNEPDRDLLLRVFGAQAAIDWPGLDEILDAD